MCNDNVNVEGQSSDVSAALVPVLDTPFHKSVVVIRDVELEKFFAAHHVGSIAFHTQAGNVHTISIGPFTIELDIQKAADHYVIHIVVYFKIGPFKKKIFETTVNLPFKDGSVCKSFNVLGVAKATLCLILENGCIWFSYDIQSVAGSWKNKIKIICA